MRAGIEGAIEGLTLFAACSSGFDASSNGLLIACAVAHGFNKPRVRTARDHPLPADSR